VISNAIGRAYHHRAEQEKVKARENLMKWKDCECSYQADPRKVGREAKDMRFKLTKTHAESSSMKEEIEELRRTKESLTKEPVGVQETHENLL